MQPSFQAKRHAVVVPAVPRPSSNSNTQHEELPPALPPSLLKAPELSQSSTYNYIFAWFRLRGCHDFNACFAPQSGH